jgi:uncharacterized protein
VNSIETIAVKAHLVLGMAENLPSPCMSVCRMDETGGLCEGCLRTLDEIACWSAMTDAGKREVWASIGRRIDARKETQA